MRRTLFSAVLAAGIGVLAMGAAMAADMPGAGKTVKAGRANWDTFWFGGAVVQIGLERLGYEIDGPKTLNNPARFSALGQGDIDYETDTIWPNHKTQVEKQGDSVELVGPIMSPGSISGYLIDRKTAEAHGIGTIDDLKNPDVAALFDRDKDGKADLIGCNPGWYCETVIEHHLGAYGLGETVEHVQGEYNVLVGDTVARYKADEPVLLFAWFPNSATVQMRPGQDLVWLQVSKTDLPGGETETMLSDVAGCAGGSGPCNTGWVRVDYFVGANAEWLGENPAARKFFELLRMALADRVAQNIAMVDGEDSEDDLRRHASEWIEKNKSDFEGWLDEARAAAK